MLPSRRVPCAGSKSSSSTRLFHDGNPYGIETPAPRNSTSWWCRQGPEGFSSFVRDILSDEDSDAGKVEIYRLQNALWTLFLGITFVRVIWNTLALPDFDSNLVLLTGVSSLTYVGLKNSKYFSALLAHSALPRGDQPPLHLRQMFGGLSGILAK